MNQIEIEGMSYDVLKVEEIKGKTLLGIWNERRQQYEVYMRTQEPKLCPMGADEYSLEVAFADAEETLFPTNWEQFDEPLELDYDDGSCYGDLYDDPLLP